MTTPGDYSVRSPSADRYSEWQLVGPDDQSVEEANRFIHAVGIRGLQPRSLRTYAYDMLCALRWMRKTNRDVIELTGEDLLDFIEYQRQPPESVASTINRRLELLNRFVIFLTGKPLTMEAWQGSQRVVFGRGRRASIVRVKEPQLVVRPLTDKDTLTFFHTLRTWRDRSIALMMWAVGVRSCEILNLGLEDVDFQVMNIRIFGKGRKERVMPLDEIVAKALLNYIGFERPARSSSRFFVVLKGPRRGQPMTYAGLRETFRYHRITSKIQNANPHRFRHTFGANMTRCRVPLVALARMMGHSSPQTTMRYVQLSDHEVRQQYEDALKTLNTHRMFHDHIATTDR
jgi:integrase/recombinase XerD